MPRYYFHAVDHEEYLDGHGINLPDEAAAQGTAARFAGQLMKDFADGLPHELRVRVTDESGTPLFEIVASVTPLQVDS